MKRKKHKQTRGLILSGQSLIEILVSLSMLGLIFVLGAYFFQSLGGIHSAKAQLQTRYLVEGYLQAPVEPSSPREESLEIQGRRLERSIRLLSRASSLYEIKVVAFWGDTYLTEMKLCRSFRP